MKGCSSRHETMNGVKDQEWFGWVTVHAPGANFNCEVNALAPADDDTPAKLRFAIWGDVSESSSFCLIIKSGKSWSFGLRRRSIPLALERIETFPVKPSVTRLE
jgi:hypothetical protein